MSTKFIFLLFCSLTFLSQSCGLALAQGSSKQLPQVQNNLTKTDIKEIKETLTKIKTTLNQIYDEGTKNSNVKIDEIQGRLTTIETKLKTNQSGINWSAVAALAACVAAGGTLLVGRYQIKSMTITMQAEVGMKQSEYFDSDEFRQLRHKLAKSLLIILKPNNSIAEENDEFKELKDLLSIDSEIKNEIDKKRKTLSNDPKKIISNTLVYLDENLNYLDENLNENESKTRISKSKVMNSVYKLLDFFTGVGDKLERNALDQKSTYTDFSYWVFGYYPLFEELINMYQQKEKDIAYAKEFKDLNKVFIEIDDKKHNGKRRGHTENNLKNLVGFLEYEAEINRF